jgi:hypothetical protein
LREAVKTRSKVSRHAAPFGSGVLVGCLWVIASIPVVRPLDAQVLTQAVSVIGVVTDSLSGRSIADAHITVVGTDLQTSTDPEGRFTLRVPVGSRRILIVRPGYEDLEAVIQVTDPMGGLLLKLLLDARSAQDSVDVAGSVTDATTGVPVIGAQVAFGGGGPRTTTGADGRFVVRNAPGGRQAVTVRRFGYRDREQQIEVRLGMRDPVIELTPDPVQLEALTVTGGTLANVRGRVVDAVSGLAVPYVTLTLTRDGRTRVGRAASSDTMGAFTIADINPGGYLLEVERLGYVQQYVAFPHPHPDPQGIVVRLDPNPALLEGIEAMTKRLDTRWRGYPSHATVWDEKRLRDARQTGMKGWLEFEAGEGFAVVECSNKVYGRNCLAGRLGGSGSMPRVYIDGILIARPGLQVLASYGPKDFYRVEYYGCGAIYVYTYAYVERQAIRPRAQFPPCL